MLRAGGPGAPGTAAVSIPHPYFADFELIGGAAPDGAAPVGLFCENETNAARVFGTDPMTAFPKDGINDHVTGGAPTVNPAQEGTKCSFWYQLTLAGGESAEVRLRLRPAGSGSRADVALAGEYDQVVARRQAEADDFYDELTPRAATADEAMVMRQAFAGLLWSKQLFYYDVARWLDGDPVQPAPPPERLTGRNARWRNFNAFDIMSMPDKWEYPRRHGQVRTIGDAVRPVEQKTGPETLPHEQEHIVNNAKSGDAYTSCICIP